MAVNINTVYTTVLYILNKEQRGYIPPAEFNSLAVQVQNEIFESYFPDGNQVNRLNQSNRQNDTEFFNMFKDISYKLHPFERSATFTHSELPQARWTYQGAGEIFKLGVVTPFYNYLNNTGSATSNGINALGATTLTINNIGLTIQAGSIITGVGIPANTTVLTTIDTPITSITIDKATTVASADADKYSFSNSTGVGSTPIAEILSFKDYWQTQYSPLTRASKEYPIGFIEDMIVSPSTVRQLAIYIDPKPSLLSVNCLFAPTTPSWTFTVGSLGQYVYNATTSINFELDIAEQNNLIINILKYAGIIINDPQIVQAAAQESQQEEINLKR